MNKRNISIKIDETLLDTIDTYAKSRCISRTKAIVSMLNNVQIIIINEGAELLRQLYRIDILLKTQNLDYTEKEKIKGVCEDIWQLLSLITEKIPRQKKE